MRSAALRQTSLALFFCAITIGLVPASVEAAEKSLSYNLGHATAQARHCGFHSIARELRQRYGGEKDYKAGLKENDLSKYDNVWGLACGKLERTLEDILERVKAAEAK